ncbi:cobalt-precorrin-6A reductase (plasmid) [Neorhizobium sp. SOG26]|uniref:Cobalt-precorrin-6A reductase n=1 Tax=Neorhizobium turbinariae TaxID=2937795 RepID=A0ABT0IWR3_9HYPH|nr:cobalt-precorrin-6A reductase [Neorhizobium sp. SOG26]AXV18468.1 cobalt-precorrin-6A reductase [Neorhizobium sp. SOG26]MCK8782332.1 cobalt-precorrin-6A reductase [Neorhizobium turbinariae]
MKYPILILGGTAEARRIADLLGADRRYAVQLSLAGRTRSPAEHTVPLRVGGFGGVEGLARYLRAQDFVMLVDATHPYAAQISANAALASKLSGVPLIALRRAPWSPQIGDRWRTTSSVSDAVAVLGPSPRRVFLTLGRQDLLPFEAAPQHRYVIRSVDPVDPPLKVPQAVYFTGRGPFKEAEEEGLLLEHDIDVVIAKNSGGPASYGKIAAARKLGIEVVLIDRPSLPEVLKVGSVDELVRYLAHAFPPV